MRGPSLAVLRLDMGKACARRWIGDPNQLLARGALNLPSGKLRLALQWLITVGTIEFEFVGIHKLHPLHAQNGEAQYMKNLFILLASQIRM
jgi:hypothetical protein